MTQATGANSVSSSSGFAQALDFEVRILWLDTQRENHCGHANADPDNPTAFVEAITVRVRNPESTLVKPGEDFDFLGYYGSSRGVAEPCWHSDVGIAPHSMAQFDVEFLIPYGGEGTTDFIDAVALFRDGQELDSYQITTNGCNNDGDCELPAGVPSLNFREDGRTLVVTKTESAVDWSALEIWGCENAPAGRVTVGQELDCHAPRAGLFWMDPWYPIYLSEWD